MDNSCIGPDKIERLIMICTGNTCRSPMACGIARREAERRRMVLGVESAGTAVCEGCSASAYAIAACAEIGVDISGHTSAQADGSMYTPHTLFAVMTPSHAQWLMAAAGVPCENIVVLGFGIPDPYGGSLDVYRTARDSIEEAVIRLFDRIEPLTEHFGKESDAPLSVSIRPAVNSDVDAVAQLENECFTDPWTAEGFAQEIDSTVSEFTVAEIDGEICGYAVQYIAGDVCEIPKICVKPDIRRRGVAAQLLGSIEQKAVGCGCTELTLEVRRSNSAARRLYDKCGFEYIGIRPNFYTSPTEDAVIMTKRLENSIM